jgi:hypothetical protein
VRYQRKIKGKGSASFDTINIKTGEREQIKASSIKSDLSSVGPKSEWDKLYFMSFYNNHYFNNDKKISLGKKWLLNRIYGRVKMGAEENFQKNQIVKKIPEFIKTTDRVKILINLSTEWEIGGVIENKRYFFKNQYDSVLQILNFFNDNDKFLFIIKIHPQYKNFETELVDEYKKFSSLKNQIIRLEIFDLDRTAWFIGEWKVKFQKSNFDSDSWLKKGQIEGALRNESLCNSADDFDNLGKEVFIKMESKTLKIPSNFRVSAFRLQEASMRRSQNEVRKLARRILACKVELEDLEIS